MKTMFGIYLLVLAANAEARIINSMTNLADTYANETQGKTTQMITQESLRDYDKFIATDVNAISGWVDKDAHKPKVLSSRDAQFVLNQAFENPVVALHQYSKYDPQNRGIGFCFGRAMFVNLYLTMANFNRANMKKAFILGSMSKGAWAWHVTTIVQSVDRAGEEIWIAIDPVAGKLMEVKEWYKHWQGSSDDGKLRLYIAEAGKFSTKPGKYDEISISNPFYNEYFTDMMAWFDANDVTKQLKLQ